MARFALLVAFVAAGLILRLESLYARAIWYDEAYGLWVSSQPVSRILHESAHNDPHPPGYYLLLWAWSRLAGHDLHPARSLSLIAWVAATVLTYAFARTLFGWPVAAGAAGLLSLNAFQVVAATEARMYMVLQLAGLISTWLLWRASQPQSRLHWWVAYGASVAGLAYLSYYSAFLMAGHGAWLWLRRRSLQWRQVVVAGATAVLIYLPWLPSLPGSVTSNTVPWRPPPDFSWIWSLLVTQSYGGHFGGGAGYYGGRIPDVPDQVLAMLPLAVAIAGAMRKRRFQGAWLVGSCWLVPLAVVIGTSYALGKVATYAYHLTYLQPYLALLTAAGVEDAWTNQNWRRRAAAFLSGSVVLAYAASGADAFWRDPAYQPFRYDLAGRYLRTLARPGDYFVYAPQGLRRVLHYYYRPRGYEVQLYVDPRKGARAAEEAAMAVEAVLRRRPRRAWVVLSPPIPHELVGAVAAVAAAQGYLPGPSATFGAIRVDLFVRRTP